MTPQWKQRSTVGAGGRVEIVVPGLQPGVIVEVAVRPVDETAPAERPLGLLSGKIHVGENFDDPVESSSPTLDAAAYMPALLDTNAFLWLAGDVAHLSAAASEYTRDPANQLFVSAASGWEIAIKLGLGRLKLDIPLSDLLTSVLQQLSVDWLAIEADHLLLIPTLPHHHKDPFDRMLVAQCRAENLPLLSSDHALDAYGIARIW